MLIKPKHCIEVSGEHNLQWFAFGNISSYCCCRRGVDVFYLIVVIVGVFRSALNFGYMKSRTEF